MSNDPRAERTRQSIRDAVIALAEEDGAAPTVSAIARRAGVNRSSFYAHFDSLEDVACQLLDDSLAEIAELGWRQRASEPSPHTGGRRDLLALVEHVAERRRVYLAVLAAGESAAHGQLHVAGVLRARFEESFLRYGALSIVDATTVQATAVGVGASLAALITAWLRGELECSEMRLAELLTGVFPEWTRRLQLTAADEDAAVRQGGHHE